MVVRSNVRERVVVQLPAFASPRFERELRAFAHYCIRRIERELGEHRAWIVDVKPALGGFASHVAVRDRGMTIEDQGNGADGTTAIWEAICRVEQRLREYRR